MARIPNVIIINYSVCTIESKCRRLAGPFKYISFLTTYKKSLIQSETCTAHETGKSEPMIREAQQSPQMFIIVLGPLNPVLMEIYGILYQNVLKALQLIIGRAVIEVELKI